MCRTARLWKGLGSWTLGGLLLSGVGARAAEPPSSPPTPPPLSRQLTDLGRQALAQGESAQARTFFRKALQLDPRNDEARRGLGRLGATVRRVALQDEAADPAPKPAVVKPAAPAAKPVVEPAAPAEKPVVEPAAPAEKPVVEPAAPAEKPVVEPAEPAPKPIVDPADKPMVEPVEPAAEAVPARPAPAQATLEENARLAQISREQLVSDVRQRLREAQDLVNRRAPEAALNTLRLALSVVRAADQVDESVRLPLDREIQAQILSTVRAEERINAERAEMLRKEAQAEQQMAALEMIAKNQNAVSSMMLQFDGLMAQGQYNVLYNGGLGDIAATTAPFMDARDLAMKARALEPNHAAPRAGVFVAQTSGFLAQELAFDQIKKYRFLLTMQDVTRASVPFPDTKTIEYPDAEQWRQISEKRIKRYGKSVDLLERDAKTKNILSKLEEPITMSFTAETPLGDVLKYIKSATTGPNDSGIPIYVDPLGLQEAEKTMESPVTLDLEGVPLKKTLRLILKQLGLTYTVKDGMLTITSESSEDQPTEIRVYPVADLAVIPSSLMGGGQGGGGMGGGGMGGMGGGGMGGGGMGGMGGGGMGGGGMGGGMGGGGMGGGGGMFSVPVDDPDAPSGFMQKKSN